MKPNNYLRSAFALFLPIALFTAFVGCKSSQSEKNIVGHDAVLTYPSLRAEVKYLSEGQLHWKTTDDKGNVAEETDSASIKRISATQFFLHWVENDGTQVSQVIDLNTNTVRAYMTLPLADSTQKVGEMQYLEGKVELK